MASSCLLLGLLTLGIRGVYCQAKNYNEIIESLMYPEKLIFDISMLDVPSTENVELGVSASPNILYCKRVFADYEQEFGPEEAYNGTDWYLDFFRYVITNHWKPLCFLFDRPTGREKFNLSHSTLSNLVDEFINDSEIIRDAPFKIIFPFQNSGYDTWYKYKLADLVKFCKSRWNNATIGLELDVTITAYSPDSPSLLRIVPLVDLVIINIDIPEGFLLGYASFKSFLKATLNQQIRLVRRQNSYCTIYVKLNLNFPSESSNTIHFIDDEYKKYYFYLLQFSVFWINDGGNEGIILKPFNTSSAFQEGLDGADFRNILSTQFDYLSSDFDYDACCIMKAILNHASTSFKSISISSTYVEYYFKNGNSCIITNGSICHSYTLESDICNRPTGDEAIPDITLRFLFTAQFLAESRNELIKAATLLLGFPIKQVNFYFEDSLNQTDPNFFSGFIDGVKGGILPSETTFACHIVESKISSDFPQNDPLFVQKVYDACSFMWNQTEAVVWEFEFGDKKDVQALTLKMIDIERSRKQFLQRFPGKSVMLRANLPGIRKVTLYCSPETIEQNERVEVVVNFARIHNIPIDVKPAYIHDGESILQWYSLARTVDELEMSKTKYTVFVARNYPDRFLAGKFQTDPCIELTITIPKDGIAMNTKYSGTSLDIRGLKNTTLTSDELQTILQFTFHKFALVETVLGSISDINLVLNVLSEEKFVSKLLAQESHHPNFYFRLDYRSLNVDKIELRQFMENVGKLILKPTGLHLSNWEEIENVDEIRINNLRATGIMVGISLETCVDEVNANFRNLRDLRWFDHVDYLLCNIQHSQETTNINKKKMENYLDTNLYIQRYFHKLFPNTSKEILFRLNAVVPSGSENWWDENRKVGEFLKFYSDVSQYATAYKTKFFMLPTFDDGHVAGRKNGWWKILDFKDLANSSVFIDKEADYLGQESWRPHSDPPNRLRDEVWTLTRIAFIVLGVIIACLLGSVLYLRVRYQRRFALLSKKEVNNFLEGCRDEDEKTFDNRKFPKEFEIPKSKFLLANIIGSGNFGVIYNATLSTNEAESLPVAVKVPNSNCSKESFKTFLSELKVLCYVGSHPHVLEFIGAYTKEIGKGITYIATELCENGALLGYLRKLQSKELPENCDSVADVVYGISPGNINKTDDDERECSEMNKLRFFELCRFSHEVALGMDYIASKKIIHGDLSARNVLLDSELRCKIGDFGLSRKLYEYQEYVKSTSDAIPWRWLAVESLKRMEFTTKSDVWSYGITLWEIFSLGCIPYPGLSWTVEFVENLENGLRLSAPKFSSREIFEKMSTCWKLDPEQRPTFYEMAQFFIAFRDEQYIQL